MSMENLVYHKGLPTEVGWYWLLSPREDPQIVYIREYVGRLAISNSPITGWPKLEASLWAGPIPEPLVPQVEQKE